MKGEETSLTDSKDEQKKKNNEKSNRKRSKQQEERLPWWVELLFVQIGLPDSILRHFLKSRKRIVNTTKNNKKTIFYLILLIISVIYLDPIVKRSRLHNSCIYSSIELVNSSELVDNELNTKLITSLANRFCNGGDI